MSGPRHYNAPDQVHLERLVREADLTAWQIAERTGHTLRRVKRVAKRLRAHLPTLEGASTRDVKAIHGKAQARAAARSEEPSTGKVPKLARTPRSWEGQRARCNREQAIIRYERGDLLTDEEMHHRYIRNQHEKFKLRQRFGDER